MAWIESHQGLERHPKTVHLMTLMGWGLDETVGKLHRFWWWCVDYCEDGNLDGFNDAQLGFAVGIQGEKETKAFVANMVIACWLDRKPYFRVHNWWKYIGFFLQVKYKSNPERWKSIRGRYIDNCSPAGESNGSNNPPNNGCGGGSKGGSSESIPKPLPLPLKEGGKGTIPRAGAEETGRLTTDTGHRTGKDEAKTPPCVASHAEEKQDGHRTAEAGHQQKTGGGQAGPRKFVNEIMKQLKELRLQRVHWQNRFPEYAKMSPAEKVEYQKIVKKIRELEKELTVA